MDDPAFIAYLEYLRYWEQPQYAKFVHYPHAFYFLEQLRRPEFRKAMANPRLAEQAHAHQFWHWQRSRTELAEAAAATTHDGGAAPRTGVDDRLAMEQSARARLGRSVGWGGLVGTVGVSHA